MASGFPSWRQHQRRAGHDDHAARFLVVTRGPYDLATALREALNNAHDELNLEEPDDPTTARLVRVEWSRVLAVDDQIPESSILSRTIHRVSLRPDNDGWTDLGRDSLEDARAKGTPSRGDGLVFAFADALSGLPRGSDVVPGIDHVIKLHDPQRLAHYADLAREIAAVEMGIRECLSVIFLRAFPSEAHTFLARTKVSTTPKDDKPTPQDLSDRYENQLFHILFYEFPLLNEPPELKMHRLVEQIRGADSFEALKQVLVALPVAGDNDSGFVATLTGLLDPVERVRNPVAHSRAIPRRAWDNYENARDKIWERIAQFWEDESRNTEPQPTAIRVDDALLNTADRVVSAQSAADIKPKE